MWQNSCPFPITYVGPKYILRYYVVCSVPKLVTFLERGISVPSPNPEAAVPHFGRHLRLLIQYTGIYPPYVNVLSSICNPRTLHAMVKVPTYYEQMNTNTVNCSKCGHVAVVKH